MTQMRFSSYNLYVERESELVVYNTKTTGCVILRGKDLEKFNKIKENLHLDSNDEMVKQLKLRGFIVEEDENEYEKIHEFVQNVLNESEQLLDLEITVTRQCNFRCIYCPQEHKNDFISEKDWEKIYTFIEKRIKQNQCKKLDIDFFGGEPLLCSKDILLFLEKLKNLSIKYPQIPTNYSIATNGYLLTPDLYDKLSSLGVSSYQITLDGFSDSHDKMRPRVDGKGTWEKIVENLKYIASVNDNNCVILRTNFNNINEDSLENFCEWELETFGNEKFLFDYTNVQKFSDKVQDELIGSYSERTDNAINLIKNATKDRTIQDNSALRYFSKMCKCAFHGFYMINPDCQVSICEQDYDSNYYGYINEEGDLISYENLEAKEAEIEECKTCIIYPLCAARACIRKSAQEFCEYTKLSTMAWIEEQIKEGHLLASKK